MSTTITDSIPAASTGHTCTICNTPTTNCCSRCQTAHYCRRECQLAHWAVHKKICVGGPWPRYLEHLTNIIAGNIAIMAAHHGAFLTARVDEPMDDFMASSSGSKMIQFIHLEPSSGDPVYCVNPPQVIYVLPDYIHTCICNAITPAHIADAKKKHRAPPAQWTLLLEL